MHRNSARGGLPAGLIVFGMRYPVGASLLAMGVNDDAGCLEAPVVPTFFASMLAPTEGGASVRNSVAVRPSSRASSLPHLD
ncbi:hypothetical protein EIY72_09685 [Pseudomonas vancouverensis]|uniref:Uncharacterized protein n=1 Tax=Pseudomonas vancouverensis TaxID=95300 RepID=A0A4R4KA11_PSEVA|nr:hypothetical protein F7R09_12750 [Pseudomonas vancouverensis]TDB64687.1 hypothetical protein EIY72_09685 [Pseudomonas vancouverensis]